MDQVTCAADAAPGPRVVLVTGASTGLGRATADLLAARGCRVYGTSRKPGEARSSSWPMLGLDVCSDTSVADCVGQVLDREGRIDALVNNAGHALVAAVEETGLAQAQAQFETNFFGAMRMMLAVLPAMRQRGHGRILNVSSVSGVVPVPFLGLYGASKHALEALSESLHYELLGTGILVTLFELDGMRTAIGFHHPERAHPALAAGRRRFLERLAESTRSSGGDPADFADRVLRTLDDPQPPLRVVIGERTAGMISARRTLPEAEFRARLAAEAGLPAI